MRYYRPISSAIAAVTAKIAIWATRFVVIKILYESILCNKARKGWRKSICATKYVHTPTKKTLSVLVFAFLIWLK